MDWSPAATDTINEEHLCVSVCSATGSKNGATTKRVMERRAFCRRLSKREVRNSARLGVTGA